LSIHAVVYLNMGDKGWKHLQDGKGYRKVLLDAVSCKRVCTIPSAASYMFR